MAVVGVRQIEAADERLVTSDETVSDRAVHQGPGALQLGRIQVDAIRRQVPEDLIEDLVGPRGLSQTSGRAASGIASSGSLH
jgi:hypothetical protein